MLPSVDMSADAAGGPVIFASFPQSHFHHIHSARELIQSPQSQWMPASNALPSAPVAGPAAPPMANPSRKRSREEFDDLDLAPPADTPDNGGLIGMEVVEEPIYGEGMTIINRDTGRAVGAESQTGTWYEDQLEEERKAAEEAAAQLEQDKLDALGRPSKSVRLDSPAPFASDSPAPALTQEPLAATPAPAIDNASMMLGIGWKEIRSDIAMEQASRGWARYIENHYPLLGGVEILCKSDGHEVLLAKATQPQDSYWLFKEDLSEGRLVATNETDCVRNLRAVPIAFENDTVLTAATSPVHVAAQAAPLMAPAEPMVSGANGIVAAGPSDRMMFD